MQYYSHVLYYPTQKPFDRPESAFFSFVGELAIPIAALKLHEHFWFTHYGNHLKFRVLTDKYAAMKTTIDTLTTQLGLVDRGDEKTLTLVQDLGHDRFLAPTRTDKTPADRALLVLRYLHSIAELVCDNVVKAADGYWHLEQSMNRENPNGSNFESLHHLFCNSTQVPLFVTVDLSTEWMQPLRAKIPVGY